jgi:hypothetical protein
MSANAAAASPEFRRAATVAAALRRDNRSSIRVRGSDPGALLTGTKDLQGRIGKLCEQLNRSLSIGVASATERGMHTELLSVKEEMDKFFVGLHAAVARIAAAENAPVRGRGRMRILAALHPSYRCSRCARVCTWHPSSTCAHG